MIKNTIIALTFGCIASLHNPIYAQENKSALNNFLEKKRDYNKSHKEGYTILLYNGNEREALKTHRKFKARFKGIKVKLTYVTPNWKVLSKTYSSKLEAENIHLLIKDQFPNSKIL